MSLSTEELINEQVSVERCLLNLSDPVFFFVVYESGRRPAFRKHIRPAYNILTKALFGSAAWGWHGCIVGRMAETTQSAREALFKDLYIRPAAQRRKWLRWTDAGFVDLVTGEMICPITPEQIAAELAPKRAKPTQWIETEQGQPFTALPEKATILMYYGGMQDITPGSNFFFVVYPGKTPRFHEVMVPSLNQMLRRLTGYGLLGKKVPFKLFQGDREGQWSADRLEYEDGVKLFGNDLQRPPEQRRLWVIWTGKGYRNMFTGAPV